MTKGLITSIKKKQKMHKTHFVQGTSVNIFYYKKYSNILTRLKDLAKRFYYHHKLNKCKSCTNMENFAFSFAIQEQ